MVTMALMHDHDVLPHPSHPPPTPRRLSTAPPYRPTLPPHHATTVPITVPLSYPSPPSSATPVSSPSTNTLTATYIVCGHDVIARLDQRLHALSMAIVRREHQGSPLVLGGGRRVVKSGVKGGGAGARVRSEAPLPCNSTDHRMPIYQYPHHHVLCPWL